MKFNKDFIYNENKKKWYDKTHKNAYYLREHCKCCGEKYFTRIDKPSDYCSYSCKMKGCSNPMYGKHHTNKVKKILSKCGYKTNKIIKEKYNVDNISQCIDIKIKKGQTILNDDYIKTYLSNNGYKFISSDGKMNKHTIITMECPNKHIIKMKWVSIKRGCRCRKCYYDRLKLNLTESEIKEYMNYKRMVRSKTESNYRKYKEIINPLNLKRGHRRNEYNLDHKYSIAEGFRNNVSVDVISSPSNLCLISCYDNTSKQDKCSISLEELYEGYNKFVRNK